MGILNAPFKNLSTLTRKDREKWIAVAPKAFYGI
jgi:hypothetical protein